MNKGLNQLLGSLTDFLYFIYLGVCFFFGNIILLVILFFRIFFTKKYEELISKIQTDELFSFKKYIEVDPLYDEDDDGKLYNIDEEFEAESIEIEDILKNLENNQIGGKEDNSNILRYIYGGLEASLLGYLLGLFGTINLLLDMNFAEMPIYSNFLIILLIGFFFFYNMIFNQIYGTASKFSIIDQNTINLLKGIGSNLKSNLKGKHSEALE